VILVLGARGFVGSAFCAACAEAGIEFRGIDLDDYAGARGDILTGAALRIGTASRIRLVDRAGAVRGVLRGGPAGVHMPHTNMRHSCAARLPHEKAVRPRHAG